MFSSRFCEKFDRFRKNLKVIPGSLDPFGKSFCLLLSVLSISNPSSNCALEVNLKKCQVLDFPDIRAAYN